MAPPSPHCITLNMDPQTKFTEGLPAERNDSHFFEKTDPFGTVTNHTA